MHTAAVMLIIKDGLILGVSRRYDTTKFGLPGVKCEYNEIPVMAAIRETEEETSIKVNHTSFIYVREEPLDQLGGEEFLTYCYYAVDWVGEPTNSEEGIVKWLTAEDLTSVNGAFADYNAQTLLKFKKYFPNIYLK